MAKKSSTQRYNHLLDLLAEARKLSQTAREKYKKRSGWRAFRKLKIIVKEIIREDSQQIIIEGYVQDRLEDLQGILAELINYELELDKEEKKMAQHLAYIRQSIRISFNPNQKEQQALKKSVDSLLDFLRDEEKTRLFIEKLKSQMRVLAKKLKAST